MRGNVKSRQSSNAPRRALFRAGVILLAVLVGELLFYTWCRVQCTQTGYAIAREKHRYHRQTKLHRELKTELARLTSPALIEARARRLGMITPHPNQMVTLP